MIIKKCEFIKSAANLNGFIASDLPQIVIAGKSNVGKSSFINFLVNNSKMAKTSNTPGRTRLINYFLINNEFFFVDLPGYGYAKGCKSEVESWGELMDTYFQTSKAIKHVIVLVDSRHLPTNEDKEFVRYLNVYRIPFTIIATKTDKLPKTKIKPNLNNIANALMLSIGNIFGVSSEKKVGKDIVLNILEEALTQETDLSDFDEPLDEEIE